MAIRRSGIGLFQTRKLAWMRMEDQLRGGARQASVPLLFEVCLGKWGKREVRRDMMGELRWLCLNLV